MDIPSAKPRTARTRSAKAKAAEYLKKVPTALLLKKKAECDARALKIVEQMIEPEVEVDWMLRNLSQINRTHMDDIVEERAILKLCGYPLCDNPLKKVVNKQYQISTLKNKVYDVSRVKNFCSYRCYTAAEYLMEQMLTSPLWHRDHEETPNFQILTKCESRSRSPPGVEVNLAGIQLPEDNDDEEPAASESTESKNRERRNDRDLLSERGRKIDESVSKETEKVEGSIMKEARSSDGSRIKGEKKLEAGRSSKTQSAVGSRINETLEVKEKINNETRKVEEKIMNRTQKVQEKMTNEAQQVAKNQIKQSSTKVKIETTTSDVEIEACTASKEESTKREMQNEIRNIETHPSKGIESSRETRKAERRKSRESKKPISFGSITSRVEKCFEEWITEETICLLRGEDSDKQKILENVRTQEKYAALCKKLSHLQVEEEREEVERIGELKPPPEFSALQEEAKGLELKVRAFYDGRTVIDRNEAKPGESANPEKKEPDVVLPMIDNHAPKALRRRIFLDKLNKVLPDLLRALCGTGQTSSSQYSYTSERCATVRALVTTFSLSATNIVFKTPEWTLVALIIIKLLAFVDLRMKYLLASKQASLYTSMILLSYKLDPNYLERLAVSLMTPAKTHEEDKSPDL